jgi:hypothetical protein
VNDGEHPLEVSLKLPVQEAYIVGKLTIQIGDNVIEAKVLSKEKA